MSYSLDVQNKIRSDFLKIISQVKKGTIVGVEQKSENHRLTDDVKYYVKKQLLEVFSTKKSDFDYLVKIEENNGSTKAPYELLFTFKIDEKSYEIYVTFKPHNSSKSGSSPFIGTIKKYISRLVDKQYYDCLFFITYESEVNNEAELKSVDVAFVKDITNYSLYDNFQLQLNVQKKEIKYGRNPDEFIAHLKCLLALKISNMSKRERLFSKELKKLK